MNQGIGAIFWRLAVFVTVCGLGIFALLAVFAQLRFQPVNAYTADFTDVSGLQEGNFVRIAGVEVGKVDAISITADNHAQVKFTADQSVVLTNGTRAIVRYENLVGGRFLELADGPGAGVLRPGGTIPLQHTQPALDLDALIGGFRPLLHALDPTQVNTLTSQIISVLQGQGGTISSLLTQVTTVTVTLADRDDLIGDLITNLNVVLVTMSNQHRQLDSTIDSLSQLVAELAERKNQVRNGVAYANAAAAGIAELLAQARPPLAAVVPQIDRLSQAILGDRDYFDHTLATLPEAYQILGRQGLWGDFFSFYLCDVVLKVNGKGGQPVYIKVAGQDSGRCTPK